MLLSGAAVVTGSAGLSVVVRMKSKLCPISMQSKVFTCCYYCKTSLHMLQLHTLGINKANSTHPLGMERDRGGKTIL